MMNLDYPRSAFALIMIAMRSKIMALATNLTSPWMRLAFEMTLISEGTGLESGDDANSGFVCMIQSTQ
jgi:hypothetical protein